MSNYPDNMDWKLFDQLYSEQEEISDEEEAKINAYERKLNAEMMKRLAAVESLMRKAA